MGTCVMGVLLLLALTGISAVPVLPETESNEHPTLATELQPPPLPQNNDKKHAALFLINLYAVKNVTDDDFHEKETEVLQDDLMEDVPEITEPFATILLLVEEENELSPVKLDDVAKDLEEEGFKVEKIEKDGETRVIKVDIEIPEDKLNEEIKEIEKTKEKIIPSKYTKVRRKRSACLKCKLLEWKAHKHGGGYGGGYGGHGGHGGHGGYGGHHGGHGGQGCGYGCGGGRPQYVPVQVVPVHQPQYYPSQGCNTCGGRPGGGSYSHAQASAQASASSYSYKK